MSFSRTQQYDTGHDLNLDRTIWNPERQPFGYYTYLVKCEKEKSMYQPESK